MLEPTKKDKIFALFLPENEIHEIGLLYLNYELQLKGYHTIYLGQTIPIDSLIDFETFFSKSKARSAYSTSKDLKLLKFC